MIAYTILIVIAIALSVAVSSYLTQFLPSQREECPSDINLVIEKASCNSETRQLSITLSNRGLFSVPAMFVRLSDVGREVRPQVNVDNETLPIPFSPNSPNLNFLYTLPNDILIKEGGSYIIEVQPAIISKRTIIPCENAIITQVIQCDTGEGEICEPTCGLPGKPPCITNEICDNGRDDNDDCLVDCLDPQCDGDPACPGGECLCRQGEYCKNGICIPEGDCTDQDPEQNVFNCIWEGDKCAQSLVGTCRDSDGIYWDDVCVQSDQHLLIQYKCETELDNEGNPHKTGKCIPQEPEDCRDWSIPPYFATGICEGDFEEHNNLQYGYCVVPNS